MILIGSKVIATLPTFYTLNIFFVYFKVSCGPPSPPGPVWLVPVPTPPIFAASCPQCPVPNPILPPLKPPAGRASFAFSMRDAVNTDRIKTGQNCSSKGTNRKANTKTQSVL